MGTKLFILFLICTGCGKEVNFKNKLEDLSALKTTEKASYVKSGILLKSTPSQITYQGQTYLVSVYSSKAALDFINGLASGSKTPVLFTGGINKKEMVIESVKRQ